MPRTYGQRLPPWFPLDPSYWLRGAGAAAAGAPAGGHAPGDAAISVRGLTKVFGAAGGGQQVGAVPAAAAAAACGGAWQLGSSKSRRR